MADYPRWGKRPKRNYEQLFGSGDQKFQELRSELASHAPLDSGRLQEIANQTNIKFKTLEGWRTRLRENPDFIPHESHKGQAMRLGEKAEREVAEEIIREYVNKERPCPRSTVVQLLTKKGKEVTGDPHFAAGRTLAENFLRRWHLSIRTPHARRRTAPDDDKVASFVNDMQVGAEQFPDGKLIINVDETCWRLYNGRLQTVAPIGATEVVVRTASDKKLAITAVAGCTKSGERLPLWILARGASEKCEDKYRGDRRLRHFVTSGKLFIDHTPNGWSDGDFAKRYLDWLHHFVKNPCLVLWDMHSSHKRGDVLDAAKELEIGLEFVPPGQTDEWQPLDRRVFGNLKKQSMKRFNELMFDKALTDVDMCDAIVILCQCWDNVSDDAIKQAWSHFD